MARLMRMMMAVAVMMALFGPCVVGAVTGAALACCKLAEAFGSTPPTEMVVVSAAVSAALILLNKLVTTAFRDEAADGK